ncbi:MAG: GNAT family protein [Thermoproteota archaeon]
MVQGAQGFDDDTVVSLDWGSIPQPSTRGETMQRQPVFEDTGVCTRIRAYTQDDLKWMYEVRCNPDEWALIQNWRYLPSFDQFLNELQQEVYRGDQRVVIENLQGEPIGFLYTYDTDLYNRRTFWTTYLKPKYRKGVYAIDAVVSFLSLLFFVNNFHKVLAHILSFNPLSLNTLLKAGFKQEGVLREHIWWNGQAYDEYVVSMLRHEYQQWRQYNRERVAKVWAKITQTTSC